MTQRILGDRYRLTAEIGSGGMGEVWEGVDERLGRPVAVKLIRPDLIDSEETVARFHREAQVTAKLAGHPNIVILYDYGTETPTETVYAVMELVRGRPLSALVRSGETLPIETACRWCAQVCSGLAAAHAAGVVHRDVKPGNVMVVDPPSPAGEESTAKILDFGISGFLEAVVQSRRLTKTGEVIGTPQYMAPEQIQGHSAGVPGDLYSLGAVLYHALTGIPPSQADHPLGVMRMHMATPPRPPARRRPDVPTELSDLVMALLAKSPEQRPSSAGEVLERLRAGTRPRATGPVRPATHHLAAPPESTPQRRRELARRLDAAEARARDGSPATAAQELGELLAELVEIYGASHPETLRARHRRAYLTGKGGYHAHAAELFAELADDMERVHGRRHADTLSARHYQAANAGRAGRHGEAARIHRAILPELTALHGEYSRRVLLARLHLAFDVGESGDRRGAITMLGDLLVDLERELGAEDPTTLTARHYQAAYIGYHGDPHEAVRRYRELLADHVRIHGAEHAETERIRTRLARWEQHRQSSQSGPDHTTGACGG
ncbi:serine/threonine-protein kinase [Salinactinospora qingdaonensis]|uniref:non-specific serine/threonine protein kinase n=1 Tax=Salinactinospora qingdaonensis TaxID=702744 RepID=A0ABP7FPQ4_9ACTN